MFLSFHFQIFSYRKQGCEPTNQGSRKNDRESYLKAIVLGLNRANIGVNSFPSKLSYDFSYPKCTNKYGMIDPISPIKIPSTMNGLLMKPFVAPTVRIIMISSLLESIVVRIAL